MKNKTKRRKKKGLVDGKKMKERKNPPKKLTKMEPEAIEPKPKKKKKGNQLVKRNGKRTKKAKKFTEIKPETIEPKPKEKKKNEQKKTKLTS